MLFFLLLVLPLHICGCHISLLPRSVSTVKRAKNNLLFACSNYSATKIREKPNNVFSVNFHWNTNKYRVSSALDQFKTPYSLNIFTGIFTQDYLNSS